jgi:hypothetical protein
MVVWAHRLSAPERNGHDLAYGITAAIWFLVLVACLGLWTLAGVRVATHLRLGPLVLRLEAALAAAVTGTMTVMTVATLVWWGSLASSSPWPPTGDALQATAFPGTFQLLGPTLLMLGATCLAIAGTTRALRAAVPR